MEDIETGGLTSRGLADVSRVEKINYYDKNALTRLKKIIFLEFKPPLNAMCYKYSY